MLSTAVEMARDCCEGDLVVVLCADPDAGVRIAYWLGETTHHVVRACDGYHAASALDEHPVRAVITDRLLPPWPGLDAFQLLRKSRPGLAIIYVGNGEAETSSLARAAGATHVLPCPLRRQSVLDALPRGVAPA